MSAVYTTTVFDYRPNVWAGLEDAFRNFKNAQKGGKNQGWIWVRPQGTSAGAYQDMCRWMERRRRLLKQARCGSIFLMFIKILISLHINIYRHHLQAMEIGVDLKEI